MRVPSCISAGIFIAVVMFTTVPSNDSASGVALLMLLLSLAILTSGLVFSLTSDEERVTEFYCYIYFLLFFLIPGYIHLATGRFPFFSMVYSDEFVVGASICVLLFSMFFLVGYAVCHQYQAVPWRPTSSQPKKRAGYELPLLYIAISVIIAVSFGIRNYTASRAEIEELLPYVTPAILVWLTLPRILAFVALLICLVGLKQRSSWPAIFLTLLAAAIFVTLNLPTTIPRFLLFSYVIIVITVFVPLTKRRKIILLTVFVIGQFTIFPAIALLSRGDIDELFSSSLIEYFVTNGDFDGFQSTINVVRYADSSGYRYGLNLLSAALFFLPRELWPGKSMGTGGEAAAFNGYDFINISAPLPSEFYVDFGMAGAVIGGFLFGALLSKIDFEIRARRAAGDTFQLFCPATITGYLFIILRGSLVGVLGPVVLTYAIMWVSTKWIERRR
jgi:oligosaccharide repeat unit polymerase